MSVRPPLLRWRAREQGIEQTVDVAPCSRVDGFGFGQAGSVSRSARRTTWISTIIGLPRSSILKTLKLRSITTWVVSRTPSFSVDTLHC